MSRYAGWEWVGGLDWCTSGCGELVGRGERLRLLGETFLWRTGEPGGDPSSFVVLEPSVTSEKSN